MLLEGVLSNLICINIFKMRVLSVTVLITFALGARLVVAPIFNIKLALTMISKKLLLGATLSLLSLFSLSTPVMAGGNSGLTIFSGVDRKDILDYYLDFGGNPGENDRYKLTIPPKKLSQGASRFFISYPDYFNGTFDINSMEVRANGKSLPLKDVPFWDKESRYVEINLETPLEGGTGVDIVFSNVRNPSQGTYYFTADAQISGEIPLRIYLGTWIISISRN